MAVAETKKRKVETDPPRVTFSTPTRTFERLLRETSLDALRSTVSKKLGLDWVSSLELCQVRDGKTIDLEDEDDFDAFKSYAASNGVAEVRIIIPSLVATSEPPSQSEIVDERRDSPSTPNFPSSKGTHLESNNRDDAVSGRQQTSLDVPGRTLQTKSKKKTRSILPAMAFRKRFDEIAVLDQNPSPQSKDAPASGGTKKSTEHIMEPVDVASKANDSVEPSAQEKPVGVSKPGQPGQSGKMNKDNEKEKGKKSRKRGAQASVADTDAIQINEITSPLVPTIQSPTVSPPGHEPAAKEPLQEPKKPRAKKQKISKGDDTQVKSNQQSKTGLPSRLSERDELDKQLEERQPNDAKEKAPLPIEDEPKGRKRKRDVASKVGEEATALKTGKPKKRKIDNRKGETDQISSNDPVAVPIGTKPKPSRAKKRSKPTPEEESQVDEALDSVIANIIARRVRASPKHIPSTEPVTTTISSAPIGEVEMMHPDEADVEDLPNSKKRKWKTRKSTVMTSPEPVLGSSDQEFVSRQAASASEAFDDDNSRTKDDSIGQKGRVQDKSQEKHPDQTASTSTKTVEQIAPGKSTSRLTTAKIEKRGVTATASPMRSTGLVRQAEPGASKSRVATDSTDLPKTTTNRAGVPPAKDSEHYVSPDYHVTQKQDDDNGSDSDGDSDSDTNDNTVPELEAKAPGGSVTLFRVPESLCDADLGIDGSMEIDSLLKPKEKVSWRKVLEEEDEEEKRELMSDVEEGESDEEEVRRKAPRNSLSVRYAPSTASEGEDDVDDIKLESVKSAQSSPPSSDIESFPGDVIRKAGISSPTETTTVSWKDRASRESEDIPTMSEISAKPDAAILPGDAIQSQPSSPLPPLNGVNERGESVFTELVADLAVNRAMEEDDTLFLVNVGKPGPQVHSTRTSVIEGASAQSAQLIPSRTLDRAANKEDSRPSGMVKRMKRRNGKRVEANDFLSQPVPIHVDRVSVELTVIKERQQSAPPQFTDSDVSQAIQIQSSTQDKVLPLVGGIDEISSKDRPTVTITAVGKQEKPRMIAKTTTRLPPPKRPSPLPQTAGTPQATKDLSSRALGTQPKSSQPPLARQNSANSASTTEVDSSERGERRLPGNPPSDFPMKSPSLGTRSRCPTPSEPEHAESDDSDEEEFLNKIEDNTPRLSATSRRGLRDIFSQSTLFSPSSTPRPFPLTPAATKFGSQTPASGFDDKDSDDDDSSSSSDSDSDNQPNIPKGRRAGSTVSPGTKK